MSSIHDDDVTRLGDPSAPAQRSPSVPGSAPATSSHWLASSGAIDHGRFAPGTLLGGRYRIVGRLGRGGMGEVYRADDLKLGQPVALKFLPPDVDRDPARLTQLHTEVRMARQVSHPNVCRVYDIDEVEGHTFLSMEYVDGEDLASLLRRIGRFPEDRGLEIARQVCAGLAAAHERGVVHRDFKPANVMVDGTGKVRITDFGLAGLAGESIRAGTPAYMAPEQLAGGEVTPRSDIYALGLVLYEVFTGRRALDGSNLAELIHRREQSGITPPSMIVRDLDEQIERAVMRCLRPEPEERPASALAVAAALPGGDPLAAALAAGETPSPEMVAAAGEASILSRWSGISLLVFAMVGLAAIAVLADRLLIANRGPVPKSADVLEDRAREIRAAAGYTDAPADTVRGVGITLDYVTWLARQDASSTRWDRLSGEASSVMRFWYRTSPRLLVPITTEWRPQLNDPPLAVSGMVTVVVDEQGRLVEFVSMPAQLDPAPSAPVATDWQRMFDAAGLPMAAFKEIAPQWTPRVYADQRVAWEGPMPGHPETSVRVEAASYRGRPVAFQIVWPWTRPTRMEEPPLSTRARVLSLAGGVLVLALLLGAALLARHNLRSGRADHRGARRIAAVMFAAWFISWLLGARQPMALNAATSRFFMFAAFAILNTGFTWMFYLALEPFVRRYCPEILISWTRVLSGQLRDPRVGRDILIGVAAGVYVLLVAVGAPLLASWVSGKPSIPQTNSVLYLLGFRYTASHFVRLLPNALQTAMLTTFVYVLLLAVVRRRSIVIGALMLLLAIVAMAEAGDEPVWVALAFALLVGAPVLFVFVRYGLLATAIGLFINQAGRVAPFTTDIMRPHFADAAIVLLVLCGLAVYAFYISRAGEGMFRRLLPTA